MMQTLVQVVASMTCEAPVKGGFHPLLQKV